MNIEPKIVTFSSTENDWDKAQRQAFFYGRGIYWFTKNIAIWIAVTLLCLLVFHGMSGHLPPLQTFLETELGILVFLVPFIGFVMLRQRAKAVTKGNRFYRLAPERWSNVSWEIDDGGLTYRQQENRLSIPWKLILRADLTRDFLLIVLEGKSVYILPRRVFADNGQGWYDAISEHTKRTKAV